MQIKLDKLGITVEFVAGQIYELEFDIPSDSMLFGVEMNGKWLFDGENFKPQFTTDAITINSRAIKELCITIRNLTIKMIVDFRVDATKESMGESGFLRRFYDPEFMKEFEKSFGNIIGEKLTPNDTTDNTDEQEINKLADEMQSMFCKAADYSANGWNVLARKMYYPKKALDEALASEREYFGLLRQIGQHLGVNVGTDVGVTELPGYVETLKGDLNRSGQACVERRQKLAKALGYPDDHLNFSGLCDQVKELREENHKLKNEKAIVPAGATTVHLSPVLTQSMMRCLESQYPTGLSGSVSSLDAYYMIDNIVKENMKLKERADKKLTMATELVDDLSDICRKLLKTSYAHTGVQGVHPGQAELFKALGKKLGVDLPYA